VLFDLDNEILVREDWLNYFPAFRDYYDYGQSV